MVASAESSISEGARLRPVTPRLRVDLLLTGQLAAMLSFMGMSGDAESTWKMGGAQPWRMVAHEFAAAAVTDCGDTTRHQCQPAALWHTALRAVTSSFDAQPSLTVSSHNVLSFECGMNTLMVGMTLQPLQPTSS